jgi:hypothetical protein
MGKGTLITQTATPIPDDVLRLLGDPPLLSNEDPEVYAELISQVAQAVRPRHVLEWIWVREFADYTWEALRLRRFKALLIERERQRRIEAIRSEKNEPYLRAITGEFGLMTGELEEVKPKRRRKKPRIAELETERGAVSSFQDALPACERLEKLLASLELKRHMLLRDAPYYREGLAHLLEGAVDKVIDGKCSAAST